MATMDDNALFVDTNVLVYANVLETPFHARALKAINVADQAGRTLWISRQVIREYLVVMTRPQAFENLSRTTVLEQVEQFIAQFQVADDSPAVTAHLLALMQTYAIGGKQVHDANLVATMQANHIRCLLTHNEKDFQRFAELITLEAI